MTKSDMIKPYIKYIKSLDLSFSKTPEEYVYKNPVLILIDATLSINRQYNNFVVPRIKFFQENYSEINSLEKLSKLINEKDINGFKQVWDYNHPKRVEILKELTEFFLKYQKDNHFQSNLDAMKHWAISINIRSKKLIPVNGIGFATSQYIRKMLGIDTVKPDIHIKRSIQEGLNEKLSDIETVVFIEDVAKEMNISPTSLDYAIWKHYSLK